ncbi:MAG: DUF1015 domain-containing protein [Oscillospiraceae bacterium]
MNNIFCAADILLPSLDTDLQKWAVLACDQFTSEGEYWQTAQSFINGADSALSLIFPEIYLGDESPDARIEKIHTSMEYCLQNVLTRSLHGFVYVERNTASGMRPGLVGNVDLESYSYEKDAFPLVRPSENTVVERIPPRLAVRRDAPLETPHIMMLLDDDKNSVIEPISSIKSSLDKLYDFDLMLGGGHITGYAITDAKMISDIERRISAFACPEYFAKKYPHADASKPMAIAVGDGNHSLATAKAYWEEIKPTLTPEERQSHPARFCLVELVNVHCPALLIEPIHRVLYGADDSTILMVANEFLEHVNGSLCPPAKGEQVIHMLSEQSDSVAGILNPPAPLAVGTFEAFLKYYIETNHPILKVDYIHDEASVRALVKKGYIGVIMPPFAKSDLFRGVVEGGVLPKKTFSMGTAREKRYYLECRKIR